MPPCSQGTTKTNTKTLNEKDKHAAEAALRLLDRLPQPTQLLGLALLLRLVLIIVAEVQDRLAEVAYTDIDYQVFTDSAESVTLGISPFAGRTALLNADATKFRYTPFLAFILVPNIWLHKAWGKLFFSVFDILAGVVLRNWLERFSSDSMTVRLSLCLWLFNPFCFTISTRGSGESLVIFVVYCTFWVAYCQPSRPGLVGLLLGFAIHWRVYPVIFGLPILLRFLGPWPFWKQPLAQLLPRLKMVVVFGLSTVASFLFLGAVCYSLYGWEFLEACYLYHGRRLDPQHNFSVYFYPTALHLEDPTGTWPNIAKFATLPQLALCFWMGMLESSSTPGTAALMQSLAFVATNKVITAQYFVWWWAMLPLAMPFLRWWRWKFWRALLSWVGAEIHWLLWAYLLEFRKWPVRPVVWAGSCIFLAAHLHVLVQVRQSTVQLK